MWGDKESVDVDGVKSDSRFKQKQRAREHWCHVHFSEMLPPRRSRRCHPPTLSLFYLNSKHGKFESASSFPDRHGTDVLSWTGNGYLNSI